MNNELEDAALPSALSRLHMYQVIAVDLDYFEGTATKQRFLIRLHTIATRNYKVLLF